MGWIIHTATEMAYTPQEQRPLIGDVVPTRDGPQRAELVVDEWDKGDLESWLMQRVRPGIVTSKDRTWN